MRRFEISLNILKIVTDFVFVYIAFLLTYFLRKNGFYHLLDPITDFTLYKEWAEFLIWSLKLSALYIVMLFLANTYRFEKINLFDEFKAIFKGTIFWFAFVITFYFFTRNFPFSRFVIVFNFFLGFVLVCLGRFLNLKLRGVLNSKGLGVKNLVIVSYGKHSLEQVVNELRGIGEYNIVGVVSDYVSKKNDLKIKWLGKPGEILDVMKKIEFDELLQLGVCLDLQKNEDLLDFCRYNQKLYSYIPEIFDIQRNNVSMRQIGDFPIYRMENTRLNQWGRVWKRLFDLVVACLALLVLWPIMLVIALLIKLDDPKSTVMWRYLDDGKTVAKRVGFNREMFYCYKFRTMRPSSHNQRYNELADKDIRKDELVKISNDPRVTKVGKFLRRFDLDELPQLFNVILGNMSLVGPRPHLPEEVARYKYHHQFVFNAKPGITGLSQVNGRSDLSFDNEVKLDSYYIENWSLVLDLKILLKTILVIFKSHGEQK